MFFFYFFFLKIFPSNFCIFFLKKFSKNFFSKNFFYFCKKFFFKKFFFIFCVANFFRCCATQKFAEAQKNCCAIFSCLYFSRDCKNFANREIFVGLTDFYIFHKFLLQITILLISYRNSQSFTKFIKFAQHTLKITHFIVC